jgi:hypothetical protein
MTNTMGADTKSRDDTLAVAASATWAPAARPSPYIVGPIYDWLFFLLPPALALVLGIGFSQAALLHQKFVLFGGSFTPLDLGIGVFIHAHLVAVFFRSHGNRKIFAEYPTRFTWVPVILLAAMYASPWVFISVSVLATFWDVYHSGLQTFGFMRLYDRKAGNDPTVGRQLDWWMNHLLYAGPIVAGATMMDHFKDFGEFKHVGSVFFTSIPAFMENEQRWFTWGVLILGTLFIGYYVLAWGRLCRQGYKVSWPKVYLLASTGLCSIYTWGFNTFGMAFFIMNFFHALQYFGIVWWSEKHNIMRMLRLDGRPWGKHLAIAALVVPTFLYGAIAETVPPSIAWWWGVTIVVSIMHFWYDGFIWSVRKRQV